MKRQDARAAIPLAITSAACLALSGGLASAASTRSGGKVHLYEADTALAGNRGTVIMTGTLADHGTDHQGVAGGGTVNKLVFSKGSFEVNVGRLGAKLAFPTDPKTCASAGSATAPVTIVEGSGTGAYRGIRGTLQTTASVASIAPRRADRRCNTGATRYPGVLIVKASGIVSFK